MATPQVAFFASIICMMLQISRPSVVIGTVPTNPDLRSPSLKQEIEGLEKSFSSIKALDPFADNINDEIAHISKIQDQTSKIMEELENISSENCRLFDNMMASLETEQTRSEQSSARVRQLKAMGLDLNVRNKTL
jgi:septal ring factor EnvC (AmiA/AmiB activator)